MPGFTPNELTAPPPILPAQPAAPAKRPSILADKRARVALVLVIPLLWITTCRLPPGHTVGLPTGERIEALGVTRLTRWTTRDGRSEAVQLSYYRPRNRAALVDTLILNLALPAVAATGDSVVVLHEVRGDWWARAFGIQISTDRSFTLQGDGSWLAH